MALPPRKRGSRPAAPKRLVAEEVEDAPRALVPSAAHFASIAEAKVERTAADLMADAWTPDQEDWIPTPVVIRMGLFAQHYLETLNAAEAARRAGYAEKCADRQGRMLLTHPRVLSMIRERHVAVLAKIGVNQERIWAEYAAIGFLDPADLFTKEGDLRNMHDVPENVRRAISGIKITHKTFGDDGESTERELKFVSKSDALEKLGRLTGLFKEEKVTATDIADALLNGLALARRRVIEGPKPDAGA